MHGHILELRAYAESRVRRKCPGRGGPCQETGTAPAGHLRLRVDDVEQHRGRQVLYVAVASGLVQLVAAKSGAGGRTVRLDSIAFIQIALLIQLFQQPPQGLHVFGIVSDVRIVQINPVTHLVGQVGPFLSVFHHLAAAGGVVLVHAYLLADVLLGDAEVLLHAEFHGKSVGIPAGLALHMEALHGLVAAHYVLDGARHYVMDTGHAVGRRRSLVEHERRTSLALLHAALKQIVAVPLSEHLFIYIAQIQLAAVFLEFLIHGCLYIS